MYLSGGFTATGGGEDVAVDLTDAQVGGTFVFAPGPGAHGPFSPALAVDGLTYPVCPSDSSQSGGSCCGMAPPAMLRSHISSWPPVTGLAATSGRPARP